MGSGRWDENSYRSYAKSTGYTNTKNVHEVFTNSGMPALLDPRNIVLRESVDSADNPNSTPCIFALDVTGSMGEYARIIAQEHLPQLMTRIIEKQPVTDPHVMFMGVDDVYSTGHGALQVSQFEADIRILEQLREIWIVGRGGGNSSESYDLPWYFAGHKTKIDSFDKRGKPGFLFTFGDEAAPYETMTTRELQSIFGPGQYEPSTPQQSLAAAQKKFQVFHVIIEQGNFCRSAHGRQQARDTWTQLLGNNVIFLRDVDYLTEVVVATMQIAAGEDMNTVIRSSGCEAELRYAFSNSLQDY